LYQAALRIGFQQMANRGMTKGYSTTGLEGKALEEMREKIRAKVQENIQSIYDDKVRVAGSKRAKSGVSRAVNTEAVRMAKEIIKVLLRKQKVKLSSIKSGNMTKAAQAYLDQHPEIMEQAKANVEAREKAAPTAEFDLSALIAGADKVLS